MSLMLSLLLRTCVSGITAPLRGLAVHESGTEEDLLPLAQLSPVDMREFF